QLPSRATITPREITRKPIPIGGMASRDPAVSHPLPLRWPASHLDARKHPHPIRPRRKHGGPPCQQQLPRDRILSLPLAIPLQFRQHQPPARSRDLRRNREPLLEALRRTIPPLRGELVGSHESPTLPAHALLNRNLAPPHLDHQPLVQPIIIELGIDRRPHQRQRDTPGHLPVLIKEPIRPREGPRLPKPPPHRREPRPQPPPLHQPRL